MEPPVTTKTDREGRSLGKKVEKSADSSGTFWNYGRSSLQHQPPSLECTPLSSPEYAQEWTLPATGVFIKWSGDVCDCEDKSTLVNITKEEDNGRE